MSLEITGKLIEVLAETTGSGKSGTWTKRDFVIETISEKYPKKICFSAWGDLSDFHLAKDLKDGDEIKLSFEASSREYNGKWYTELRAWKIDKVGQSTQIVSQTVEQLKEAGFGVTFASDDDNSLPF